MSLLFALYVLGAVFLLYAWTTALNQDPPQVPGRWWDPLLMISICMLWPVLAVLAIVLWLLLDVCGLGDWPV